MFNLFSCVLNLFDNIAEAEEDWVEMDFPETTKGEEREISESDWDDSSRKRALELRCKDIVWYGSRNSELFGEAKKTLDDLLSKLMDQWVNCGASSPQHVRRGRRGQDRKMGNNAKRNLWPKSPKISTQLHEGKMKNVVAVGNCKKSEETSWMTTSTSFDVLPMYEHKRPCIKEEYILGNTNTKQQLTENKGRFSCDRKMNNDSDTFGGARKFDFLGKTSEVRTPLKSTNTSPTNKGSEDPTGSGSWFGTPYGSL